MDNQLINTASNQSEEKRARSYLLPHYLVFNRALNVYERLCLIALLEREDNFKGQKGRAIKGKPFYITQEWLAIQLGISESTVKRSMKVLEGKHYINRTLHKGEATTYSINWTMIEGFNKEFSFVSTSNVESDFKPLCLNPSSSSKLENITRETAAPLIGVKENPTIEPVTLPSSVSELSRDFLERIINGIETLHPRTPEDYLVFFQQIAKASNCSVEYVQKAWKLVLPDEL